MLMSNGLPQLVYIPHPRGLMGLVGQVADPAFPQTIHSDGARPCWTDITDITG